MKYPFFRYLALLLVFPVFSSYQPHAYLPAAQGQMTVKATLPDSLRTELMLDDPSRDRLTDRKDEVLLRVIMQGLKTGHYENKELGDEFSKQAFDIYLEKLDYNKVFFTQADVDKLRKFQYLIDDEIQAGTYNLFEVSNRLLDQRIEEASRYPEKFLAEPFDLDRDEAFELDAEKRTYAANEKALRERWRQSLKYQVINRMHLMEKAQKAEGEKAKKTTAQLEAEAREKVRENQQAFFKRLKKTEKNDRLSTYINSIAGTFDPHTDYFPPKDKENFDISISGQFEGIGASLQEQPDGYIKVTEIIPGSASWRQGRLKAGDLLLKVQQDDDRDAVDVVDMRVDNVVKLIRGPKGTNVRITVRRLDGSTETIPITRDVVILEETYAKSAVVEDKKTGHRVGYIFLPVFYADFNNDNGRSCADDVRQELAKLQSQGVDGIVIDLRNNGGGSLQDVVQMAGLFIESGPVVQVKSREGKPYILRDTDSGIQYDGPLAIMVNSFSASASEILAAAMQDYQRGVVVGSAATYGKGTVQRFFNLDDFLGSQFEDVKPLGAIKLTTQKFYRIDGHATQLKGVEPDIVLPDPYTFLEIGEKEQKYAMAWDEISSLKFDRWKPTYDLAAVRRASEARVAQNPTFSLISENAQQLRARRDATRYSLRYSEYHQQMLKMDEMAKRFEDLEKDISQLNVRATERTDMAQSDTARLARAEGFEQKIRKDLYVYETMNILRDMK